MFDTLHCSVLPLKSDLSKRRSKSLNDIISKIQKQDTMKSKTKLSRRRHSAGIEINGGYYADYNRLATIYGWVTTTKTSRPIIKTDKSHHHHHRCMKASRSFSHIPITRNNHSNRFSRIFSRKATVSLFPNKTITGKQKPLLLLDWMNDEEKDTSQNETDPSSKVTKYLPLTEDCSPPSPPIENDPYIFDLLTKDSPHFIHFSKNDMTITSATIEKLVEKLTRELDNDFLMDFFITFRQFLTPIKLCKLLILRFRWALMDENDEHRLIRIRTFVVIRHWLTHYWSYDFVTSKTLRFILCTFLTQLQTHPVIHASPRDERIIKSLRNIVKRQRKAYISYSTIRNNDELQQQIRKDSAIGIIPCSHHIVNENHKSQNWTSKMKKTIQKTVSQSIINPEHQQQRATPTNNDNHLFSSQQQNNHHRSLLFSFIPMSYNKSLILKYKSITIAQQFCLLEKSMLQNVTWDELVELRWKKRSTKKQWMTLEEQNRGVEQLIAFFNMTSQWVASEIVRSHQLDIRVKVIEKYIKIAIHCYHYRNYSTLLQILLGLQSPSVTRLERTWQKVDHYKLDLFNKLKELSKPFKNWKNVRNDMTKVTKEIAESFAVETVLTQSLKDLDLVNGSIPFLGLYLSDLVFISELPTFITSNYDMRHDNENTKDKQLYERLSSRLVNYNKFRITASVIKHVLTFQVLSRAYKFKIQQNIYSQLQSMPLLDNSQLRSASLLCEE
ncbi:ras guanine nucleotide exchange factor domain-containing protein [Cokeromyces recurvatus]|uniref:ras guanine nucleotide exchange factor domain-containing protein n=1 Tax=Cokeromyces recurvatus TaxID=90255 RepID=UPI00221EC22C|nr:ras guanine nucleotide exchange factor domain-containing protein [Cokeromyces recurvatus]KAI7899637.1 ras guanine nucleotide exchange factor domain-containing protein [Cokeromyces recurvatus]